MELLISDSDFMENTCHFSVDYGDHMSAFWPIVIIMMLVTIILTNQLTISDFTKEKREFLTGSGT